MHRWILFLLFCFTVLYFAVFWQGKILVARSPDDPNELICKGKFNLADSLHLGEKPINEVVVEMGKSFIGISYEANTLETQGPEHLVVNLQTLDCVLLYENSLALARCIKKGIKTFENYKKELQFVRYRTGIINGYPSRLHYTTDYFYDNEKKGVLKDITQEIGGVLFRKRINFMSTHPELYPRLQESPEFVPAMQKIEDEVSTRKIYHIPKSDVKKIASTIKDGDIIGITTSIDGLDCSHTGLAIWQNGALHLLHAPAPGLKVQVTEMPFWKYLARIKRDEGIIVARPLEP